MKGRECIWWEQTPGKLLRVQYQNHIKCIQFIKYEKRFITYKCIENNKEFVSAINTFICKGHIVTNLFPELSEKEISWKYQIGEIVNNNKQEFIIVDKKVKTARKKDSNQYYTAREKWYRIECLDCHYDKKWLREDSIFGKNFGCACCRGQVLVPGKNDLATICPEISKYLTDPNEMTKHTRGEHIWLNTTCPDCGTQKDVYLINLYLGKYSCDYCSDGVSYGEKFMSSVLKQLGVAYIFQFRKYHAVWCENYIYDFYIPQWKMIIEVHGGQHYYDTSWGTAISVQNNDEQKRKLAHNNNIVNYIVIDARISDMNYIKNSIISSALKDFCSLNEIDWNECHASSLKKYMPYTYQKWKSGNSIAEISEELKISPQTIRNYIKKMSKSRKVLHNNAETN